MQRNPPQHKGPSRKQSDSLAGTFWHVSCGTKEETLSYKEVCNADSESEDRCSDFVAGFLILPFAKQGRAQESPKQQKNVSETQLRAFAKVYVEVEKIRQAYEPRLKEAKNPEEGKQIQNEAASKMQGALTKEGLTEESYIQIFEVARADEGLHKKLVELINEERQKS